MTRDPVIRELKTWPPYFQEIHHGRKNFEVRKNDRGFLQFDILKLREFDPARYERKYNQLLSDGYSRAESEEIAEDSAYTGRECERMVGYVLYGGDPAIVGMEAAHSGISPRYVVLSLVSTPRDAARKRAAYEASLPPRPWRQAKAREPAMRSR